MGVGGGCGGGGEPGPGEGEGVVWEWKDGTDFRGERRADMRFVDVVRNDVRVGDGVGCGRSLSSRAGLIAMRASEDAGVELFFARNLASSSS